MFKKKHSSDFKNYRKALKRKQRCWKTRLRIVRKMMKNPPLHGLVISLLKKQKKMNIRLDTGEIKRIKFFQI